LTDATRINGREVHLNAEIAKILLTLQAIRDSLFLFVYRRVSVPKILPPRFRRQFASTGTDTIGRVIIQAESTGLICLSLSEKSLTSHGGAGLVSGSLNNTCGCRVKCSDLQKGKHQRVLLTGR
jgi:hypothetical protein